MKIVSSGTQVTKLLKAEFPEGYNILIQLKPIWSSGRPKLAKG